MKKIEYVLCGYINMFKLTPDFMYPIYCSDNKYFFANGTPYIIENFIEAKTTILSQIQFLPKDKRKICGVGDRQIYIYLLAHDIYFMGNGEEVYKKIHCLPPNRIKYRSDLIEFFENFKQENKSIPKARLYGTGKRKTAVARVYLVPGTGNIVINHRDINEYFGTKNLKYIVRQPLELTETQDKFDVLANVKGGGYSGQAGAIRHGISRALLQVNGDYKKLLKTAGYITCDSRKKERKKPGLKAARKAAQFSK